MLVREEEEEETTILLEEMKESLDEIGIGQSILSEAILFETSDIQREELKTNHRTANGECQRHTSTINPRTRARM